jgi:hypothetical protein
MLISFVAKTLRILRSLPSSSFSFVSNDLIKSAFSSVSSSTDVFCYLTS